MPAEIPGFATANIKEQLDRLALADFDALPYGVVVMAPDGTAIGYNIAESRLSGLSPDRVIGRHFFREVAPCADNAIVAHRFDAEATLDAIVDYVFAFRLRPAPVQLRLIRHGDDPRRYLLVAPA